MKRWLVGLFLGCVAATTALSDSAPSRVMIGEPSWIGARIMAKLIGHIAAERFQTEVGYVPRANAGIFAAMDLGKGEVDVHPDVWLPNQQSFVDVYVNGKGTVSLSDGDYEGHSGFCVPTEFARKYDVRTVFDLKAPRLRGLLDTDGNGHDDIWIGEDGWASTNVHRIKLRDYGLDEILEHSSESEQVFLARIDTILARGLGAVFHCYTPHFLPIQHDVLMLEEPEHDPEAYRVVTQDQDADWFEKSRIASGDRIRHVVVAYSNSLKRRAPNVAHFLGAIDMASDDISRMAYLVQVENQSIEEAVADWADENSAIVDGWLRTER